MSLTDLLERNITDVPDFPKPGIVFKDITPLLQNHEAFATLIDHLAERYGDAGITQVVGVESRGFIFGAALASALGVGLTLVRKPGKLPRKTHFVEYDLEYGTDALHIHADALTKDDTVVIIDDVLATGGTAAATSYLVDRCDATIHELCFLMELSFLDPRAKLHDRRVYSVLTY